MSAVVPIILSILLVIAFVIFIIVNSYFIGKEKKYVARPNMPFIEINSEIRKAIIGYGRGIVEEQIPKPNGTWYFKILPDDVLQGEEVKRPDFKELIVGKDYVKRYAEGEAYPRRQLIEILPLNRLDLPERMRGSNKGDILEEEGENAFIKQLMGTAMSNNREAIVETFKEYAMGEISKTDQRRLKELSQKEKQILGIDEKSGEEKK